MLIIPDKDCISESLSLSREYGLGFEYNDFYSDMDNTVEIDRLIAMYTANKPDYPCTVHGAFFDISVGSEDERIRGISRLRVRQSIAVCKRLAAQAVIFHTNTIPNCNLPSYQDRWLKENAVFYAQMLEENPQIDIYIENMFDFTPDLLCRLAQHLSCYPNFGVCLDFAHACLSPTPIQSWISALKPMIRHCHLNDCDGHGDSHWPLGRGILDIEGFFALLAKHGITSTFLLEVKGIKAQRQSLEYLESRGLKR